MALAKRSSDSLKGKYDVNPSINRDSEAVAEDFKEIAAAIDDHAVILDNLTQSIDGKPFYGIKTSLALFEAEYPDAVEGYGIIDPGNGNPQTIATVTNGTWTNTNNPAPIQRFDNKLSLPSPGILDVLYVIKDEKLLGLYYDGSYKYFGKDGYNGKSTYQEALDNGFVGSPAEWLASLVGPEGPAGPPGAGGSGITKRYLTYAALVADQANQTDKGIYHASDASGFSTVDAGYADFEYLGTTLGTEADYRKLSEEESMDIVAGGVQSVTGTAVDNTDPKNPVINSTGGQAPANEAFNTVIQFDKDKYNASSHNQIAAIPYTLNGTGNIDGKVVRHKIVSDAQNTITFPAGWNVFNKAANNVYPSGLQVLYFTYMGGDVDVSIPSYDGTVIIPDTTAPTLSNTSVTPTSTTTANFSSQINEAGTIFWAVYPSADTAHTKTQIENGTSAIAFGNIATVGGVLETASITGLTNGTAYKVHYFARDAKSNETVVALTAQFSPGASIIVMQDNFDDNSINTGKWTLFNPEPSKVQIVEEGGKLALKIPSPTSGSAYYADRLESVLGVDSGTVAAEISGGVAGNTGTFSLMLATDINNRIFIGNGASVDPARIYVVRGGTTVYSLTTGLPSINNKFKVFYDRATKTTKFYYYNAGWVEIGTYTDTVAMPTGLKAVLMRAQTSSNIANQYNIDNLYLTNANFTTATPS